MRIKNILQYIENTEKNYGSKVAFEDAKCKVTYTELVTRSKQIGSFISKYTEENNSVLIVMDSSPRAIEAMFGTVYAGCFYTPIDGQMPADRVKLIISTLRPKFIITEKKYSKRCTEIIDDIPVFDIEDIPYEINEKKIEDIRLKSIDTDLLYILFTSGSTGIPKGVSITHRGVIDFGEWVVERFEVNSETKFASPSPLYSDMTVFEIFSIIIVGGTINFFPKKCMIYPNTIPYYLEENGINTLFWVPSTYALVANADALKEHIPQGLVNCFFGGDVMPCKVLNYWRKYLPNAKYANMYGPTEITCACTHYIVDREFADDEALPIGYARGNERIYLIDGEICVGGTGVSPGYFNSPEKTSSAFVRNPLRPETIDIIYKTGDLGKYNEYGELVFLGRKDFQIKRNGYRIEPGEIETALLSNSNVENGCCIYDTENQKIICFYVGEIEDEDLLEYLKTKLPAHMIPDRFLKYEKLPLTGVGKIDRVALKQEYRKVK